MANDAPTKSGGLSATFGKVAKHMFSATMVFMMVSMSLPALGALVDPTLTDAALALTDHYGQMFTAPFSEGDTIGSIIRNTADGNFSASYEFGSHAGHGASMDMAQGESHGTEGMMVGHGGESISMPEECKEGGLSARREWFAKCLTPDQQVTMFDDADYWDDNVENYTDGWSYPDGTRTPTEW